MFYTWNLLLFCHQVWWIGMQFQRSIEGPTELHMESPVVFSAVLNTKTVKVTGDVDRGENYKDSTPTMNLLDTAALTVFMRLEALCTNLFYLMWFSIVILSLYACWKGSDYMHFYVFFFIIFYLSSVNPKALYMPVNIVICVLERIRLNAFLLFCLSSVNLKALYMPVNKFSIQRIMHFFTEIVLQVSFNKSKYKMGCKVTPLFS